jgi:SAM-dependent methyltransferase
MLKRYEINEPYCPRLSPNHHDDSAWTDQSQREVYQYCAAFMTAEKLETVVDVGCGSGFKLLTYLGQFKTVGIETEPCYSALKRDYPEREWRLSGEPEKSFAGFDDSTAPDVVLCCDVIEHIVDPDVLLDYLLQLDAKYYIVSTPCRAVLCNHPQFSSTYGHVWNGPPLNTCHVREWTMSEFIAYISAKFFVIYSSYGEAQIECQYHLLRKR